MSIACKVGAESVKLKFWDAELLLITMDCFVQSVRMIVVNISLYGAVARYIFSVICMKFIAFVLSNYPKASKSAFLVSSNSSDEGS